MTALCFISIILSWWSLGEMFRCFATLRCVSDPFYCTKKITCNVSAFHIINVRSAAGCSNALMKLDIPNTLSEILQLENIIMPKAKKVKVNWFELFKQIKAKKKQSSPENGPTNAMQGTSCSVPESGMSSADSDIIMVFDSKAQRMREAQQAPIIIDCDDNDDISVDHVDSCNSDMQHNTLMKSDVPNTLSETSQLENVLMPKAQKVKLKWFKLEQIKSKKNWSSPKNRPTNVMQGTSCSVPKSDTSVADSDIIIMFDSKAEKMRKAQQAVINIDGDHNDDISVDRVDSCNSDMQHNIGTVQCSANNGPVGDICYTDVQNSNSSKLSAKIIPEVLDNMHLDEGTSKTIFDSWKQTELGREMLKEKRHWQYTHFGSTLPVAEVKDTPYHLLFTVMSYNLLAHDLLHSHMYLYDKHKPNALVWKHRSQLLYSEIQEANADILCLQEVQEDQLRTFYRRLNHLGYASIYKKRTGHNVDGVAIYYKKDVFELVDHTSVEYYQPGISILDRHNVGLIAKLAIKSNPSRYLVVATTHLLYNPNRHDVKLAQTQVLLAEVERFAFKGFSYGISTYWPVIITGDMNFEPYTGVYRLLAEGMFRYEGLSNKTLADNFRGRVLSKELLPRSLDISDTCQHWGILCMRAIQQLDSKTQLKFLKIYNTDHQKILKLNVMTQTPTSFENFVENTRMMELVNSFVPFCGPSSIPPLPDAGYATGQLTHNLNLCSVYKHGDKDKYPESEVTTNQGNWVTVDYIFYRLYLLSLGKAAVMGALEACAGNLECIFLCSFLLPYFMEESQSANLHLLSSCIKNESDEKIIEGNLKLISRCRLPTASEAASFGPIPNDVSPSDHYPLLATFLYTF